MDGEKVWWMDWQTDGWMDGPHGDRGEHVCWCLFWWGLKLLMINSLSSSQRYNFLFFFLFSAWIFSQRSTGDAQEARGWQMFLFYFLEAPHPPAAAWLTNWHQHCPFKRDPADSKVSVTTPSSAAVLWFSWSGSSDSASWRPACPPGELDWSPGVCVYSLQLTSNVDELKSVTFTRNGCCLLSRSWCRQAWRHRGQFWWFMANVEAPLVPQP